jgi:hypothetical protein
METPTEYRVESPLYPLTKEQILHSAYFQAVASTANLMIMAGGLPPDLEQFDELVEVAIALTDKLIEEVGKKI